MAEQKVRVRLKSYDHQMVDASARKIVDILTHVGAKVVGPVPLPTKKNVYCVLKPTFIYKDSREHFEMRTHKRLLELINPSPKVIDSLVGIDLPAGVDFEIRV